ncbi:MAG: NUDIX hydrolase [Spirosomaceae bacterium]|nr:NUDIX hydrolase [Spirosomataceae bacterium]
MLKLYKEQTKCLVALDSIIFGFDNEALKVLLVKRGIEPNIKTWSLMGGWLQPNEGLDEAANRILKELTGLDNVYLEQVAAYGNPERDPVERTVSITYFALINVSDYGTNISDDLEAKWFGLDELPELLFDHQTIVFDALQRLRYKASHHFIGFELLPEKFTLPQLQKLYEAIYDVEFDKRNFSRKLLATNFLLKTEEKQRGYSKKGAYYYSVDKSKYDSGKATEHSFLITTNAGSATLK